MADGECWAGLLGRDIQLLSIALRGVFSGLKDGGISIASIDRQTEASAFFSLLAIRFVCVAMKFLLLKKKKKKKPELESTRLKTQ